MLSNEKLRQLAEELANSETDSVEWETIREKMITEGYKHGHFNSVNFRGKVAEEFLKARLEDLSLLPQNPFSISGHGITAGDQATHYSFDVNGLKVAVYDMNREHKGFPASHTDYDAVVKVDGIPTIFEVKMYRKYEKLAQYLATETVNSHLEPLREYFAGDLGYIMVVRPEMMSQLNSTCSNMYLFVQNGSVAIPICRDFETFQDRVLEIGLSLKFKNTGRRLKN